MQHALICPRLFLNARREVKEASVITLMRSTEPVNATVDERGCCGVYRALCFCNGYRSLKFEFDPEWHVPEKDFATRNHNCK